MAMAVQQMNKICSHSVNFEQQVASLQNQVEELQTQATASQQEDHRATTIENAKPGTRIATADCNGQVTIASRANKRYGKVQKHNCPILEGSGMHSWKASGQRRCNWKVSWSALRKK
jgi:regulator of replication initiation timing